MSESKSKYLRLECTEEEAKQFELIKDHYHKAKDTDTLRELILEKYLEITGNILSRKELTEKVLKLEAIIENIYPGTFTERSDGWKRDKDKPHIMEKSVGKVKEERLEDKKRYEKEQRKKDLAEQPAN